MSELRRISGHSLGLVLAFTAVSACSPIVRNHGYTPPEVELAEVQVGQDTRETVADKIGAPLNEGFQRDEAWYYVSTRRETRGLFATQTLERQVVAVDFAQSGRVENIRRYALEDGNKIVLTSRVTNPAVSDVGFLRGIFGNIGTPTAEDFLEN